jgi:hypothetical protein
LTILNIVSSFAAAKVFLGSFDFNLVSGYYGNLALFEAMLFLLFGSSIDFSHTAKWSSAMKLLKLRKKDWNIEESREAERNALV